MSDNNDKCELLPHHEQQELCTTRLPYRQGRKLTAVKVYSINNESKHLLVFGVPSLNLRQETKFLFQKFGKLLQFNLTKYPSEQFTETYHALFENIQSARLAKKMLDTKNFYGGNLHISYAPEFETIDETKEKIFSRKKSVISRLKNLEKEKSAPKMTVTEEKNVAMTINSNEIPTEDNLKLKNKLFMGDTNSFNYDKRQSCTYYKSVKRIKLAPKSSKKNLQSSSSKIDENSLIIAKKPSKEDNLSNNINNLKEKSSEDIEIIDISSANKEIVTNIHEALNYEKDGVVVKKVPYKPLNKIQFHMNTKSLL